jgi:hypothetical protein
MADSFDLSKESHPQNFATVPSREKGKKPSDCPPEKF